MKKVLASIVVSLLCFSLFASEAKLLNLPSVEAGARSGLRSSFDGVRYGEWPMFHCDERNTGYSSFETTAEVLTEPHLIWSYNLPSTVMGSPVVADVNRDGKKEIFIDSAPIGGGGPGGRLVCLNESGHLMWAFQPYQDPVYSGSWAYSTPALGDVDQDGYDEILYWSKSQYWYDYHQALYCIEANDTVRWSRHFVGGAIPPTRPAADNSIPTIANITNDEWLETVVQYAGNEYIMCFDHDGAIIWHYYYGWIKGGEGSEYSLHTASAIADLNGDNSSETVFSICYDTDYGSYWKGGVLCVGSDGSLLWSRLDIRPEYYRSEEACSSPVIDDVNDDGFPEVLIGGFDGVYCLNGTGGNVWFYPITAGVFNTVATADVDNDGSKEIVFGADDNYIYCLSSTGALKWKRLVGGKVWSSVAIADIEKPVGGEPKQLEVVVGSLDGKLYCLNSTGGLLWTYNAGASIYSSPAIVDLQYSGEGNPEIIFAASNRLYALRITPAHDIAITNIAPHKSSVGQGYNLPIQVTVNNKGDYSETSNVTLYAGITLIGKQTITDLTPGGSAVLVFEWDTKRVSKTTYVLKATADPVPGEYHPFDNALIDGTVTIQPPVHDVAIMHVTIGTHAYREESVPISVDAENQGNMREAFEVTVYANETEICATTADIDCGESTALTFLWTVTLATGNYTITAKADTVLGETEIDDNTLVGGTTAIYDTLLCISPHENWLQPNQTFTVDVRVQAVYDLRAWQVSVYFDPAVLAWVSGGYYYGYNFVTHSGFLGGFSGDRTLYQITFRAVAEGISPLHISLLTENNPSGLFDSAYHLIPYTTADGEAGLVSHEVAPTEVTPFTNVVSQGYSILVNVTVENKGFSTEDLNVTVSLNETAILSQSVYNLVGGSSVTLTLTLNTTGLAIGHYIISAFIIPVPGETDPTNNNLTAGSILVTIPGDVDGDFENGHYDVDLYDAVRLFACYGAKEGDSNFDPNCDIDNCGQVFLFDAVILLSHYGQKYP